MPQLPLISELPPASLARLRALNPELDELLAPAAPELANEMAELEARMVIARDAALAELQRLMTPPPLPTPPVRDNSGSLVFRYAAATVAFIYIFIKAGVFG